MTIRLRQIAHHAGWPLLADTLEHLNELGEIHSTHIDTITSDDATALGEDYIGKAIDLLEADIVTGAPATSDPLDEEQVRAAVTAAAVPAVMVEFLAAVHDRGQTSTDDIEYLTRAELADLYDNCITPTLTRLAEHLRDRAGTHAAA